MAESKLLPSARLAEIRELASATTAGSWSWADSAVRQLLGHIDALEPLVELGQIVLDTTDHTGACHLCGRANDSDTPHDDCPVGVYLKEHR